jgi:hypothetical protein
MRSSVLTKAFTGREKAFDRIRVGLVWKLSLKHAPALPLFWSRPPPSGFIEPCLPTLGRTVPTGAQWAYEIDQASRMQGGQTWTLADTNRSEAPVSSHELGICQRLS